MIRVEGLYKSFNGHPVLRGATFRVEEGRLRFNMTGLRVYDVCEIRW